MTKHVDEIVDGNRFEFGRNWSSFLSVLDDKRIGRAEESLRRLLGDELVETRSFLDIGSGSGIVSLVARRLGMRVVSFDYDAASVACTNELKRRYYPDDHQWRILEGSILDEAFVKSLGRYDFVYSWGVLHHTGAMWRALQVAIDLVDDNGWLVLAIYNDQGPWSRIWKRVKRIYNQLPRWLQTPYAVAVMIPREMKNALVPIVKLKPMSYFEQWLRHSSQNDRGMSRWYDLIDWVGGYPFEVAKPEEIFAFCKTRGFVLERLGTCGGELGCNEFVFRRAPNMNSGAANRAGGRLRAGL